MKTRKTALLVGFIALQLFGCAGFAGWVRQHTYPPTFHYITDQQLRSTMWRLAYHSRALRELMAAPEELPDHRNEVLQHLHVMEQATIDLNRTGWPSNHALIDANRTNFLHDIKFAQEAVSLDPPNFLLVASVSGTCAYCHASR